MTFSDIWLYGLPQLYFKTHDLGVLSGSAITVISIVLCALTGYFLGSINVSIIVSGKMHKEDIRNYGSGNAGMTNVLRTYGKKEAALTFAGDFLKGVLASLAGRLLFGYYGALLAGLFCVLGHIFPIFYKFKGGKGIVAAAAMIVMTEPWIALILIGVFAVIVAVTKYVSLGSVVSVLMYPILMNNFGRVGFPVLIAFSVAVVCTAVHVKNIKRIMNGTENKLSFKKKSDPEENGEDKEDKKDGK